MTIRTPKSFYFKHGVIEFTIKNKQIFYSILVWNKEETTQSLIKSGLYHDEKPEFLITQLINGDGNLEASLR